MNQKLIESNSVDSKPKTGFANSATRRARKKRAGDFLERTLANFAREAERAIFAEEIAKQNGLLQKIDPRVKIVGLLALVLCATLARNFWAIVIVFAIAVLLAVLSEISIRTLAKRAWTGALVFTGTLALPALFTTPGAPLFQIPIFDLTITKSGATSAAFLIFRVETSVTLSLLLVLTTLWAHVLKALRVLRVPAIFVLILLMTYRYLFVLLETAQNMFEARRSRQVGRLSGAESRRLAAANIGVLLGKSFALNTEIYLAMQSRGFRGEIRTLDEFAMQSKDWLALAVCLAAATFLFWLGQQDSLLSF